MIEVVRVTGASYSLKPIGEASFKNTSLLILTHILPHLIGSGLHLCERKDVVHHVLKNISRFDRSLEVRTYFHVNGNLRLHGFHSSQAIITDHVSWKKRRLISGKFIVNTLDSDLSSIGKYFWVFYKHAIYLAMLHKAFAKGQISIIIYVVSPSTYLLPQTWSNLLLRS